MVEYIAGICSTFQETVELFFQSSCTVLHVFHQCMRISLALHPHQHLNIESLLNFIQFSGYLLLSHRSLVGISLMINGAEHLFFFSPLL